MLRPHDRGRNRRRPRARRSSRRCSRPSQLTIDGVSRRRATRTTVRSPALVRKIDHYVGNIELGVAARDCSSRSSRSASLSALHASDIGHHQIGRWWTWVVRGGTFAIALLGAAYATQQQRQLAMDLVSRKLSPRGRLVLGIALKLFTVVRRRRCSSTSACTCTTTRTISRAAARPDAVRADREGSSLCVIPIGGALIVLHSLLHAVIDVDYLVRGKLPPERARSGH